MAKNEPPKRQLKFENFDALMNEVRSLSEGGYKSNGNWNLAQACGHVSEWMQFPIDGFPTPPFFMRPIFWLMKISMGSSMKRNILANGFKGGMPTAPETVPEPDAMTDQQAIEQLQKAVDRLQSYIGELHPSPLFGPMDMKTLIKVSLLHAEHHLGYLEPTN